MNKSDATMLAKVIREAIAAERAAAQVRESEMREALASLRIELAALRSRVVELEQARGVTFTPAAPPSAPISEREPAILRLDALRAPADDRLVRGRALLRERDENALADLRERCDARRLPASLAWIKGTLGEPCQPKPPRPAPVEFWPAGPAP